jgi:hypothetical protein
MNDKLSMIGVATVAAITSYISNTGPGPRYDHAGSPGTAAGASASRAPPRMLADVRACTMDAERGAISGGLARGSCTVLRAGEEIEVQFWFGGNSDVRAGERDLEPCVRPASWPREAGVSDPRESRDCVVISRADFEESQR